MNYTNMNIKDFIDNIITFETDGLFISNLLKNIK